MKEKQILWVEDDPSFRSEMQEMFGRVYDMEFAKNARQAQEVLDKKGNSYDLVCIDLYLEAELDGFEVIQEIKDKFPIMPIVVISQGQVKDLVKAQDLGADKILAKSEINAEEWLNTFNAIIEQTPHIFFSHNSIDKPIVRILYEDLKPHLPNVWIDEVNILPGDSIPGKVYDGLSKANFILAFLSSNSINSKWVMDELETAKYRQVEEKITIIPILLDIDINQAPLYLKKTSFIDLTAAYKELLNLPNTLSENYSHSLLEFTYNLQAIRNKLAKPKKTLIRLFQTLSKQG